MSEVMQPGNEGHNVDILNFSDDTAAALTPPPKSYFTRTLVFRA